MEIKFLGTGNSFDYKLGNSAAIVERGGKMFLIDAGFTVYPRLRELGLTDSIDHILITHLHADHVGSLGTLLAYISIHHEKLPKLVYTNETFRTTLKQFLDLGFELEGKRYEFIDINTIGGVDSIDTTGQHVPEMPSNAFYFTSGDKIIYYSGDNGQIETTLLFLEEHRNKKVAVFQDISPKDRPAHVNYKIASEKLKGYDAYGYHCSKKNIPNDNTLRLVENFPEFNY